jgi:hypothetical protein
MSEETSVIVAESAHDSCSDASRSKTVILSNSAGVSNTAEIRAMIKEQRMKLSQSMIISIIRHFKKRINLKMLLFLNPDYWEK